MIPAKGYERTLRSIVASLTDDDASNDDSAAVAATLGSFASEHGLDVEDLATLARIASGES